MALAGLLEHQENLDVAMVVEAAGEVHLLAWDLAVMAECQVAEAAEVGEP